MGDTGFSIFHAPNYCSNHYLDDMQTTIAMQTYAYAKWL